MHPHAELMLLFAQDAAQTATPWQHWQYRPEFAVKNQIDVWLNCEACPRWSVGAQYRRKSTDTES